MQRPRRELEQRLEARFGEMVREELKLTREEFRELQDVMQSFREDRRALNRSQASLRHRLRDPGLGDVTDEEAREILQEMIRLRAREVELYRMEQQRLLSVLSPSQLLRFYSLREALGRRLQQLRRGRGPGSQGPPGFQGGGEGPGLPGFSRSSGRGGPLPGPGLPGAGDLTLILPLR
jgi:Spy/CpxP family protein refolding chaperone